MRFWSRVLAFGVVAGLALVGYSAKHMADHIESW